MSTIKTKKVQVGTDSTASNNFTIYTPGTPDGTVRIGNGNAGAVTDAITLDSSGNITAAQNLTVSGDLSVTGNVPANTGPAFSAYIGSSQTVTTGVWTKANFNTEEFDTNSCYNNSTYDFIPTVSGYYQVNIHMTFFGTSPSGAGIALFKNGAVYKYLSLIIPSFGNGGILQNSCLIYCNGTTDYISAYGYCNASGTVQLGGGAQQSAFQASLVRAV